MGRALNVPVYDDPVTAYLAVRDRKDLSEEEKNRSVLLADTRQRARQLSAANKSTAPITI